MSTGKLPLIQITGTSEHFYEHCYVSCQPESNGCVSSTRAVELLKTSGLPDSILSEIWECSDSSKKGYLTKYEFHVALKLVALAQHKIEPKIHNLQLSISNPKLNIYNSNHNINATISPTIPWSISIEEQTKYSKIFDSLDSINGHLSGEAVKPVFINSKLPVATLGQVWTLSDIDKDGSLDREEFILAMYLIYKCLAGEEPPWTLPQNLIPPSKRRPISVNNQPSFIAATSTGSLHSSLLNHSIRITSQSDWVVGKLEKERYDTQFFAADKDKDGFLSGHDIRDTFVQSGLPQNVLAKIWDLCDVNKSGMLNSEQFALAMHLINEQISSVGTKMIPSVLTSEMIPPSLRSKLGDFSNAETLTMASFGLKAESDDVYKEIEIMRRERALVEHACRQCEADYKCQVQDVADLQDTLDRTVQTAAALCKQKEEAQHRLDELTEEKHSSQLVLDETRHQCREERQQLEALTRQIGSQSVSIEEKRDELKRLQVELNELIRKESSLRDDVQQHHSRLAAIEQETSSTDRHIVMTEDKNKELESLRVQLQEVLRQYDSVVDSPHQVDVSSLPDSASVDKLLSSSLVEQDKSHIDTWPADEAFTKDSRFSVADPFATSGDPFSFKDPFASNNGWTSSTAKNTAKDQNTAFLLGNVEDIFANMSANDTFQNSHFESNGDLFGFGDSPFDNAPEKILPPPRPTKAPQAAKSAAPKSRSDLGILQTTVSEKEQLSWAKQESERLAREDDLRKKKEKADYDKALKLSQAEFKKTPKSKK